MRKTGSEFPNSSEEETRDRLDIGRWTLRQDKLDKLLEIRQDLESGLHCSKMFANYTFNIAFVVLYIYEGKVLHSNCIACRMVY